MPSVGAVGEPLGLHRCERCQQHSLAIDVVHGPGERKCIKLIAGGATLLGLPTASRHSFAQRRSAAAS